MWGGVGWWWGGVCGGGVKLVGGGVELVGGRVVVSIVSMRNSKTADNLMRLINRYKVSGMGVKAAISDICGG